MIWIVAIAFYVLIGMGSSSGLYIAGIQWKPKDMEDRKLAMAMIGTLVFWPIVLPLIFSAACICIIGYTDRAERRLVINNTVARVLKES